MSDHAREPELSPEQIAEVERELDEEIAEEPSGVRVGNVDDSWRGLLDLTLNKSTGAYVTAATQWNAILFLKHHPDWCGVIVRDAFRDRVICTKPPPWQPLTQPAQAHDAWTDSDTRRLQLWYDRAEAVRFPIDKCEAAITLTAEANEHHAVRDYLGSLAWDGTPRVDALCHRYLGAHATDYARAVSISFLIGAVARVQKPGCQLDTLPILEGPQGSGKSSACRALAGEWFSDSAIDFGSKDSYQQLPGVWLYELSELDALNRRDVARVKAFISAPSDRYRPSFGKRAIDVPRQVCFIGTTNAESYLSDDTGARRFLPIRTGRIDLAALARDRDQLWAEAAHRYAQGEPWHLSGRLAAEAADEQEERRIRDPWEETIPAWLAGRVEPSKPVTTSDVLRGLGIDAGEHDKAKSMRAASVLRLLGWERRRTRIDGSLAWLYSPPQGGNRGGNHDPA